MLSCTDSTCFEVYSSLNNYSFKLQDGNHLHILLPFRLDDGEWNVQ